MRSERFGVGWLVALGVSACVLALAVIPAQADEAKFQPSAGCSAEIESNELLAAHISGYPANGATVSVGTPVMLSGESSARALTFSVASSPALLSSPDIDSGAGSLALGTSLYAFTSTKATATSRTVYWAASFTVTPMYCDEGPRTFTTPARTITVVPSTEGPAKPPYEEAEEVVTGSVSLDGPTIAVQHSGEATVKLTCTGNSTCSGRLGLVAESSAENGRKSRTIGTATYSISAETTESVKLTLNAFGRALLSIDHGRRSATLLVHKSFPVPSQTQAENVRLVPGESGGKTRK
jgi:hypothetical protein